MSWDIRTDSSYKVYFSLAEEQMFVLLIQMLTQPVLAQK